MITSTFYAAAAESRQTVLSNVVLLDHLPGLHDQRDHGRRKKLPNLDVPGVKPDKPKPAPKKRALKSPAPAVHPERHDISHTKAKPKQPSFGDTSDLNVSAIAVLPSESADGQDEMLRAIMRQRGFDKPAAVVSKEELDASVAAGATELWRGMLRPEWAEQFRSGDLFVGTGAYGSGIYTTKSKRVVQDYGTGDSVVRMALKADAQRVTDHDIDGQIRENWKSWTPDEQDVFGDRGRYAAALGYDVIVPAGEGAMTFIVLNRTALLVEQGRSPQALARTAQLFQNVCQSRADYTRGIRLLETPFSQLHASLDASLIGDEQGPQNALRSQFFAHLPGLHDQRDHGRKGKKHVPSVDVPNVDIPDVKPGKEKKATKTPSTRVTRPRIQSARLSEAGIADAVGTGITGRQQLTGGGNAFTDIVRTQSGATLVWKKVIGSKHRSAKRQTDGETLGSKLAAAIGAPAPHVHQLSEDEVVMEFMAGTVAAKASKTAQQKAIRTEAGHRLGLLDLMTQAYDRSGGNWIIDGDGNPIGIDHAFAFDDLGSIRRDAHGDVKVPDPYEPVFEPNFIAWDGQGKPSWKPNAMSVSEMAQIRQRVTELQPEFEAAGRLKWFQDSLEILDTVAKHAAGSGAVS